MLNALSTNLWLLRNCRDLASLLAMKSRGEGRLHPSGLRMLRLRCASRPILYRPNTTDVPVVWEVFYGREYCTTVPWNFRSILDCGANIGVFAAFAMSQERQPERYIAVEPDPAAFAVLREQMRELGLGDRAHAIQAAVWSEGGRVRFDDSGESWAHRIAAEGRREVAAFSVEQILDSAQLQQCDLLKLDIEGGEAQVLGCVARWGRRVKALVCELHPGRAPVDAEWFARTMMNNGFRPFSPGRLFRGQPAAVREDCIREFVAG